MCVAALAWQAHPDWPLVAIGNRDEFHARPAAPLAAWPDSGIIAGRDLKSGGTWMGVSTTGRLAIVTNLRGYGGPDPDKASRGALVTGLLSGSGPYANVAETPLDGFNPFNLILADERELHFLTNRPEPVRTELTHGIYGLSNGALDAPWPKTLQLKAALLDWLTADSGDFAPLFAALANEHIDQIGLHPREPSDVPVEASETPVFIRNPVYGTRCGTVIAVDRAGNGTIIERRFDRDGIAQGDTALAFQWAWT